jgi:hypothetical protein
MILKLFCIKNHKNGPSYKKLEHDMQWRTHYDLQLLLEHSVLLRTFNKIFSQSVQCDVGYVISFAIIDFICNKLMLRPIKYVK